jgi:hypothetical protein
MPYAIQTTDKPGTAELRLSERPAHLEYLTANQHLLLAAGALIEDDGAVAEQFIANDPFTKAGLFEKVTVTRWRKAFFDGRKLV